MKFNKKIEIEGQVIAEDQPCYIIAEAGVNHHGNMNAAKQLIDVAVSASVNAIKFQSFKTENLILKGVEKAGYQKETTGQNQSQYEMLKSLEISLKQTEDLMQYCKSNGVTFLTTPFDEGSLKELDILDLPAYKVASTDLTNIAFLRKIAQKGKPVFLSTGMSEFTEVEKAVSAVQEINQDLVILQCVANYPIPDSEANLNVIHTYKNHFDALIGYSDHSVGIGASPYAVAMGAKVIEKHFTLDKTAEGPDHRASLDPNELKAFVQEVRKVEAYMGSTIKTLTPGEVETRKKLQKCLVAAKHIASGEEYSDQNIIAKRTGGIGIGAIHYDALIGTKAKRAYEKDEIIEN
ncbi:MAG: N-acetylneuraminate synthase family protein [Flavobacteriales bacterium]|nr:N-acetylneuraminate synthase family protein [Flavobacteriales bacterium]